MNDLLIYPNCSKGGVTSVIRGRAVAAPERSFYAVFQEDRGGRGAFADIPNIEIRIVRRDRLVNYVNFAIEALDVENVSILSMPGLVDQIDMPRKGRLTYEFHSSDVSVLRRELTQISLGNVDRFAVPSRYMANVLRGLVRDEPLRQLQEVPVEVWPNLVDDRVFNRNAPQENTTGGLAHFSNDVRPLIWVGRFDKGKAYRHFIQLVAQLPGQFRGIMVVSLESEPGRMAEALSEMAMMGVDSRIDVMMNLSQREVAALYRSTIERGGGVVSTSLLESFGYSIAEAAACGARVAAYDLPALREHEAADEFIEFARLGSVKDLAGIVSRW